MELMTRGAAGDFTLTNPELFKFHRYLLIVAHARCFSTLLGHILGSHRQICGYSEAMIKYDTPVDLIRLNCEVYKAGNYRSDCAYVLDKLLYDNLTISDAVLGNPRVTPILIVRKPEPSIVSQIRYRIREHTLGLVDWGAFGTDPVAHGQLAATYYIHRVNNLKALCERLEAMGKPGIFLAAESLLTETSACFRLLERELKLEEPLVEEYRLFRNTGFPGSGDTSATIRSGRLVRDRGDQEEHETYPLPEMLMELAQRAYEDFQEAVRASTMLVQIGE